MSRWDRFERWLERLAEKLADPELWKAVAILAALLAAAVAFFWVAAGFDALARGAGSLAACRPQGNAQALAMFLSPFVIGLACVSAAGEFFSQTEERRRYKRPLRWGRIALGFGLAIGFLAVFGGLMLMWC